MTTSPDWRTLDKDLARLTNMERAAGFVARPLVGPGLALLFMALAGLAAALIYDSAASMSMTVAVAAVIAAYLAINIGANDVAHNMGPAVGSKALPMAAALVLAALAEAAGAMLGGSEVVTTVSRRLVDPATLGGDTAVVMAMLAAAMAAALWINIATWASAPVSTTQAVVGAVVGACISAAGFGAVDWLTFGRIALSWMLSPVVGALLAMALYALVRHSINRREDRVAAASAQVPLLLAGMGTVFSTFILMKLPATLLQVAPQHALGYGLGIGALVWLLSRPLIRARAAGLANNKKSLKTLFHGPLVVAAVLMSFAHGANDIANATAPLAAILHLGPTAITGMHPGMGPGPASLAVPLWVLMIGAMGMAIGILLFGPRLIRMVGSQITKLNPQHAYCIATSAALTVVLASWLGLPVSTTHVAVGGVFGLGFFREYTAARKRRAGLKPARPGMPAEDRRRRRLVRRSHVLTILAAWLITVPASALLAGALYRVVRTLLG